jgi:hypothetical protein
MGADAFFLISIRHPPSSTPRSKLAPAIATPVAHFSCALLTCGMYTLRKEEYLIPSGRSYVDGINLLAVLVAALSSFLLGGLWYSPALFGRIWSREAGRDGCSQPGHSAKVFALSFLLALVAAWVFAIYLGPKPGFLFALGAGLAAGLGLVAASFGINYLFASRSLKLWMIDGGYHTAQFVLFGVILGLWH